MTEFNPTVTLGKGPSITFIHGWGLNHSVWLPVAEQLAQYYKVTLIDLPGFGNAADKAPNNYSLENVAHYIERFIPADTTIIGWSLGGLVASYIAINIPAKINGLITVASSPSFVAEKDWHGIQPNILSMFHKQLSRDARKTIDGFLKIQAMGSPHLKQDIKQIRQLVMSLPQPSQLTLDNSLKLLETVDLREETKNITAPFLRLYGSADSLVPKEAAAKISELAPNSTSYIFKGASHACFISHPEEFLTVIKSWLSDKSTNV